MEALDALLNRVSAPRLLDPAPTAEQREVLFAAALRAPDHGQLRPCRFLTVEGDARHQLGEILAGAVPGPRGRGDSSGIGQSPSHAIARAIGGRGGGPPAGSL